MSFASITQAALDKAASVFSGGASNVTYQGNSYSGVVAVLSVDQKLAIGGFEPDTTNLVTISKTSFPQPQNGAQITVNAQTMRIVSYDEDAVSYTLHCADRRY